MIVFKVSTSYSGAAYYCERLREALDSIESDGDGVDLAQMAREGEFYMVNPVEMTREAFEGLPDFPGW